MLHQTHFGSKVVKDIDITRHLLKYAPEYIDPETRPVTAIAPGVLGTTGIETVEIIKGIVDNIKPKLVIVIDSLSSKSIERISHTGSFYDVNYGEFYSVSYSNIWRIPSETGISLSSRSTLYL